MRVGRLQPSSIALAFAANRRTPRCSTTTRRASASRTPTCASTQLQTAARGAPAAARAAAAKRRAVDLAQPARRRQASTSRKLRGQIEVLTLRARRGAEAPARPVRRPRFAHAQDGDRAGSAGAAAAGAAGGSADPSAMPPPTGTIAPCRRDGRGPRSCASRRLPPARVARVDPAAEQRAYDAALDQFKRGDYSGAIASFTNFVAPYPRAALASSAQYWVGNAQFARRDYARRSRRSAR